MCSMVDPVLYLPIITCVRVIFRVNPNWLIIMYVVSTSDQAQFQMEKIQSLAASGSTYCIVYRIGPTPYCRYRIPMLSRD